MRKILYAASECAPFIKTGGLGSVLGSLPRELDQEAYDVRVVIPAYECIDEKWKKEMKIIATFPVWLGWRELTATVKCLDLDGIKYYFIENRYYFCGDSPYGDLGADVEKFCFFCKAVVDMLAFLKFRPDIIHCHDWQSAMIPPMLRGFHGDDLFYQTMRTIMTIHNLRFQGITGIDAMKDLTGLPDWMFGFEYLGHYGNASMLKGGIAFADQVTTVSRTYAQEIQTQEYGEGLEGILSWRSKDLSGIVNGIDYDMYNPAKDEFLEQTYSYRTFAKGRPVNKLALQRAANLPEGGQYFTMGIVSRLTDQKGFDLFHDTIGEMLALPMQLYILGGGQPEYETFFRKCQETYPEQVYLETNYTDEMAKKIYGGCDLILMPSKFEPCGLCQLMSLRYGAVPLVRKTGGLKDTVSLYGEEEKATGFGFGDYDGQAFLNAVLQAYEVYRDKTGKWDEIVARGMRKNYSWKSSAKKYQKMYDHLLDQ